MTIESASSPTGNGWTADDRFLAELKRHPLKMSATPDRSGFIGKQSRGNILDLENTAFISDVIGTMVFFDSRAHEARIFTQVDDQPSQSAWQSQVEQCIAALPMTEDESRDDVRHVRLVTDLRWPLVKPFAKLLQLGTAPALQLDHIIDNPADLLEDRSLKPEAWRFATLTHILWFQGVPDLKTDDLLNPNRIWKRLQITFGKYHSYRNRWQLLKEQERREELGSLYLAVYERTLALLADYYAKGASFEQALGVRLEEDIKNEENLHHSPIASHQRRSPKLTPEQLTQARTDVYLAFLLATCANCHVALDGLQHGSPTLIMK